MLSMWIRLELSNQRTLVSDSLVTVTFSPVACHALGAVGSVVLASASAIPIFLKVINVFIVVCVDFSVMIQCIPAYIFMPQATTK